MFGSSRTMFAYIWASPGRAGTQSPWEHISFVLLNLLRLLYIYIYIYMFISIITNGYYHST